jgi:excisionase family DNA binding protein
MAKRRRLTGSLLYAIRFSVFQRDQFTCQYCGQRAPNVQLELEHRIPVCEGGTDEMDNLVTACTACNRGKEWVRIGLHQQTVAVPETSILQTPPNSAREPLDPTGRMLTVAEAAEVLGLSKRTVARRLDLGLIRGHKVNKRLWLIPAGEVEVWKGRGKLPPGRPRRPPAAPPGGES